MGALTGTPSPGEDLTRVRMRGIEPAYLLLVVLGALVVVAALLGGFNSVLSNGRIICQDCIGLF